MTRGCIGSRFKNILPGKVEPYGTHYVTMFGTLHHHR